MRRYHLRFASGLVNLKMSENFNFEQTATSKETHKKQDAAWRRSQKSQKTVPWPFNYHPNAKSKVSATSGRGLEAGGWGAAGGRLTGKKLFFLLIHFNEGRVAPQSLKQESSVRTPDWRDADIVKTQGEGWGWGGNHSPPEWEMKVRLCFTYSYLQLVLKEVFHCHHRAVRV